MKHGFVTQCLKVIWLVLITAAVLPAQDTEWARAMLEKENLHIDFKNVAKGQEVYFKIPVKNIYKEEIQITRLWNSAGCFSWDEANAVPITIPSGKERELTLRFDTIRFQGAQIDKKAYVSFFVPSSGVNGMTTMLVEGNIRPDVVVDPGSIRFGSVPPDEESEQRITVKYLGPVKWNLVSAACESPHVTAEIVEKTRENDLVIYELVVKLKDMAPMGPLHDQVILVTNDPTIPEIAINVDAKIEPEIVATTAHFGALTPGKSKKIQVIVRCTRQPAKPFKIEKIESANPNSSIEVKVTKSDDSKPLHVLTLFFTPPNQPGLFEEEFFLTISGCEQRVTFKAKGRIGE